MVYVITAVRLWFGLPLYAELKFVLVFGQIRKPRVSALRMTLFIREVCSLQLCSFNPLLHVCRTS